MFFMAENSNSCFNVLINLHRFGWKTSNHCDIVHEKTYFNINERVLLKVSGEELSGGKCLGRAFFRWELSGRELPGGELSVWGYFPGETVRGGLSGGEFAGHPENTPTE